MLNQQFIKLNIIFFSAVSETGNLSQSISVGSFPNGFGSGTISRCEIHFGLQWKFNYSEQIDVDLMIFDDYPVYNLLSFYFRDLWTSVEFSIHVVHRAGHAKFILKLISNGISLF